jgi:hypothetical protein
MNKDALLWVIKKGEAVFLDPCITCFKDKFVYFCNYSEQPKGI